MTVNVNYLLRGELIKVLSQTHAYIKTHIHKYTRASSIPLTVFCWWNASDVLRQWFLSRENVESTDRSIQQRYSLSWSMYTWSPTVNFIPSTIFKSNQIHLHTSKCFSYFFICNVYNLISYSFHFFFSLQDFPILVVLLHFIIFLSYSLHSYWCPCIFIHSRSIPVFSWIFYLFIRSQIRIHMTTCRDISWFKTSLYEHKRCWYSS